MDIVFKPIGYIRTEFKGKSPIPIQSVFGKDKTGMVELFPEYVEGLKDLDGFSYIYLIYHFNQHKGYSLTVKPYLDNTYRGLFSTRAPRRPNGIGISIVELLSIEKNIIHFKGADMMDRTPLLDIKPYIELFDSRSNVRCGWFDKV